MGAAISDLMLAVERGDRSAADALFTALYAELHRLARRELARHGMPMSLGATTLLHEAYIDVSSREGTQFPDRARFMGYAARVMRGLIIDHARRRCARKRGGRFELTSLGTDNAEQPVDDRELEEIGAALDELAEFDPQLANVVDLKFFCGFSLQEIAAMRGVTERTVQRAWQKARLYLYRSVRAGLDS